MACIRDIDLCRVKSTMQNIKIFKSTTLLMMSGLQQTLYMEYVKIYFNSYQILGDYK